MDVKTEVLHFVLDDEVFERPPPGFEYIIPKIYALKVLKALYELQKDSTD